MQPGTDLCKKIILTQNNNNMLLIVVPSGIRTTYMVKLTMLNVLGQLSAARQQLLNSDYRAK